MNLLPRQTTLIFCNKGFEYLATLTEYCHQEKIMQPIGKIDFEGSLYTQLANVKSRMQQMYNISAPKPKTQGKGCAEVDFHFGTDYLTPVTYLGMIAESIQLFTQSELGALETAARILLQEQNITLD